MQNNYRPIRDYRRALLNSTDHKDEFRTSVEELQKLYEPFVDQIAEESSSKKIKLVKCRGNRKIVRTLILSPSVKHRLNQELPRIKRLSDEFNGFSTPQLRSLLKVGGTSARKYVNILLASGFVKSDGRRWAAKFQWNESNKITKL